MRRMAKSGLSERGESYLPRRQPAAPEAIAEYFLPRPDGSGFAFLSAPRNLPACPGYFSFSPFSLPSCPCLPKKPSRPPHPAPQN